VEPFAEINLNEYDYDLPDDRIAVFPAEQRDESRILISKPDGSIVSDIFRDLARHVPAHCTMVFNDSRVIPARLTFRKSTGSSVELLCLRPLSPSGYQAAMMSRGDCTWECMAGNKRRFKSGRLEMMLKKGEKQLHLSAENMGGRGSTLQVRFSWDDDGLMFQDVISLAGRTPLPPYIKRPDEEMDRERYQTIYSRSGGSVAAPTAGLHFTPAVLSSLAKKEIRMLHVTLHVGAGTFLPVKTRDVKQHDMHAECIQVTEKNLRALVNVQEQVLAVGTTAARTLESLYWLGVMIHEHPNVPDHMLHLGQWEPYGKDSCLTAGESFNALLHWMEQNGQTSLTASTKLMIVPGYRFRATDIMLTNFHQPRSTLLLLLAAFTGDVWRDLYRYALDQGFRFLSYGDASLFFRKDRSIS
jgi:S-adenosylmethionine:tRNA ribosyltransferase-isomerase